MATGILPDARFQALLESLLEMAALGERAKPLPLSEHHDEVDAIAYAFNVLLGELRFASLSAAQTEALGSLELRAAKDEAERANAAKSAFLRNVSHELRTPLTVLLASTEILTRSGLSPETRQETTERIIRAGNVLLGLIDNVLDISKIEAGRIDYIQAPFRLDELLADITTSFAAQASAKGLRLEVVAVPEVVSLLESDPRRMRQILFNLVGNAIKYTGQGLVRVETQLQGPPGSARLFFSVTDTGPGVSQEEQSKLFQLFGRATDTASMQGSGLGLYLSRKLAVGLGGALELAATEPGRGSRFELYVPVKVIAGTAAANTPAPSTMKALQGCRILIADDNADIRGVLRALFEIEGAAIAEAVDGDDAVQKAWSTTFDVILLDVRMPNKTGLEAVRELRAAGYRGAVLALTADAVRELRDECLAAGYDDYIAKPIDFDLLVAKVREHSLR